MIDFNYTEEKQYIPIPKCYVSTPKKPTAGLIDSTRISNISVIPKYSFSEYLKMKETAKNE